MDAVEAAVVVARVNFLTLIISSVLFTYYYVKSAGPAALEQQIGETAYKRCEWYRWVSSLFMTVASFNYVLYYWYPLPVMHRLVFLPTTFPWTWKLSATIAVMIGVPSGWLMYIGVRDAGEETMAPRKEHTMYEKGIYQQIRHPQALGEFPFWFVIAFLVHSPFLVMFSILYIPVWYYLCRVEENDLLIRFGSAYEDYMQQVGFWFPKNKMRLKFL